MEAVLANDLSRAVGSADRDSLDALSAIVSYVYNQLPGDCWGSYNRVADWIAGKTHELGRSVATKKVSARGGDFEWALKLGSQLDASIGWLKLIEGYARQGDIDEVRRCVREAFEELDASAG